MKKLFSIHILTILILSVIVTGCGNSNQNTETEAHEEHGESEGHEEESTTVSITEMQAKTIDLEVGELKPRALRNTVQVTGMLELFPEDRAEISPLIGGNMTSIKVVEGDMVKKGQVIAYMENMEIIQMQQELQIKYNSLDYLNLEYERQEKLFKENVSSAKVYQSAKAEYLSVVSAINGLKVKLQMLNLNVEKIMQGKIYPTIPITTPIDGYVHLINVNVGEFADPQMGRKQVMFEITNNTRLHAEFRVFEKDIYKVKKGQKVYFTVANRPDEILEATIHSAGKAFEEDKKSVHFRALIDNPNGELLPGMYIEGKIATENTAVLAVPEDAIVVDGNLACIFVQTEEGEEAQHDEEEEGHDEGHNGGEKLFFKKVQVTIGKRDNGYVEIKLFEPLPAGTMVVGKGAYTLSSEMIKGELEHEH